MSDERIYDKLDEVESRLNNIDKTLAINTELLSIHIKRTAQIEDALAKRDEAFDKQLEIALQPIKAVQWIASFAKQISAIAAGLAALAGLMYALLRAFPG